MTGHGASELEVALRGHRPLERLHALGSTPALASPESRLLYRFPKPDVLASMFSLMENSGDSLEEVIAENPDQWFAFSPLWPDTHRDRG